MIGKKVQGMKREEGAVPPFFIQYSLFAVRRAPFSSNGFTIIELLIATAVFSMILILITFGVIRFNEAYYRGLTQSSTQNVARTIMSNVAQTIEFNNGTVAPNMSGGGSYPTWSGLCVNNQFYQYQLGKELVTGTPSGNQVSQAMLRSDAGDCTGATPGQTLIGSEMLSPHMRLSDLEVTSSGTDLYKINVRVVYGDDDLICAASAAGSCSTPADTSGATAKDAQCKSFTGSQFCAEADLSTVVQKRIN
jgi:prepilin-type N-terminal cleavage/methylation domain-containing protein